MRPMRLKAALLALALPLVANGWAQILPAGDFKALDGRPGDGKTWKLSDAKGQALAATLSARAALTPISIDYEHQAVLAPQNGQPAPSAGWMLAFEWRVGEGLFARVDWTDRAKGLIGAREYRYISPVILFDPAGNVTGLHNAALVAVPAIVGMEAVQAALSAAFPQQQEPLRMNLTELLALLGLAADATPDVIKARVAELTQAAGCAAQLNTALGLTAKAEAAAALAALSALRATPDASTLQQVATLSAELATLRNGINEREVVETVDRAIGVDKKLLPAQRDWAIGLGKANRAQLSAFLASAVPIPGLNGQGDGGGARSNPGAGAGVAALSATQADIAKRLGIDPTKYAAQLKAETEAQA